MTDMKRHVRLTSTEIANLWSQYVNDSMSVCLLTHFIKYCEDQEIKSVLEYALDLANSHIKSISRFLKEENYPIPVGFSMEDVNLEAPPLFSDKFLLIYMHIMSIHGLVGYTGALTTCIRDDQVEYFSKCHQETIELYRKALTILLEKGILTRPPHLNAPERADFVQKQSFLTGWFGDRRPLNAIEVSGIFFNMQKNIVKIVLEIGFAQVVHSKEIKEYLQRGEQLCDKHFDTLGILMSESNLPSPPKHDAEVTNSTVAPFSDKLMLFQIISLISTASGYYGAAFSLSQRRDLGVKYAMMIAEIAKYAEDGVNIMINNGWLEQPPTFDDRKKLADQK
ncbi:DUF3231 family protein [Fredinandcohnia sp. 179-A 10B2 NHS]|uniref:DUF3231 family protein n=1 Tax=Fredinandcohnia sp. 179-A 10B2 NHS TaxID=3235176 RepID=UPI0039A3DBC4